MYVYPVYRYGSTQAGGNPGRVRGIPKSGNPAAAGEFRLTHLYTPCTLSLPGREVWPGPNGDPIMTATTTLLTWTEAGNTVADCKAKTQLVSNLVHGCTFQIVKTNGGRYRLIVDGTRNGSDVGGAGALDAVKLRAEEIAATLESTSTPVPVVADDPTLEAQAVEAELVVSEPHLGDLEEVPFDTTDEDDTPLTPDEEAAVQAELERIAQRRKEAEEDAAEWDAALNRREQPKGDVVVPVVAAQPAQPKAKKVKAAKPATPKADDDGFGPDGWGRTKGGAPAQHKSGRAQVNAECDANGKRLAARGRGWWLAWVDGTQLPGKFKNMNEAKAAVAAALGTVEG